MLQPQTVLPFVLDLVGGFIHVTTLPVTRSVASDGAVLHTADVSVTPDHFGCHPDDYRVLASRLESDGVVLYAFRDLASAARIARALGTGMVSLPGGFPEMVYRTTILTTALWRVATAHPDVTLSALSRGLPLRADMPHATFQDRAVAVLASRHIGDDVNAAVVWAVGVTDAYGLDESHPAAQSMVNRREPFTHRQHRNQDLALIRTLAHAYAQARTQHPDISVGDLLGCHPRWEVLRHATPRTRAIALAAVALGRTHRGWDVDRAVMLIDGSDTSAMAAILEHVYTQQ